MSLPPTPAMQNLMNVVWSHKATLHVESRTTPKTQGTDWASTPGTTTWWLGAGGMRFLLFFQILELGSCLKTTVYLVHSRSLKRQTASMD